MNKEFLVTLTAGAFCAGLGTAARGEENQASVAAALGTVVLRVHAEGAQIYECSADRSGTLAWKFREPIATLLRDGQTVGRHFAGPSSEMADGSRVVGKVVAHAPGATAKDIPWLRLEVSERRGEGLLKDATRVQRIDTAGGVLEGPCPRSGDFRAEPYAADYIFSRP